MMTLNHCSTASHGEGGEGGDGAMTDGGLILIAEDADADMNSANSRR